ncbi:MAG: hypothetical protein IPG67_02465 [Acidobacteria bacterium]|nr:hypothetical protein [Acidobacteriota bacterium]
MPINYKLAEDVKPQFKLLIAATVMSIALWAIAWYFPIFGYIAYPLQLLRRSFTRAATLWRR